LDFFDRCGCSASLHPPLAVLGSAPAHRAPLSRQDHITNPSSNSPTKSTIYAIFAQYFPIL
uniref:hypothetical protein n=1 Tax=Angelakisella sp. TaxID=1935177 RepID=UPI00402547C4